MFGIAPEPCEHESSMVSSPETQTQQMVAEGAVRSPVRLCGLMKGLHASVTRRRKVMLDLMTEAGVTITTFCPNGLSVELYFGKYPRSVGTNLVVYSTVAMQGVSPILQMACTCPLYRARFDVGGCECLALPRNVVSTRAQ